METVAGSFGEVLAQLAPGPDLAALLATVDLGWVSDFDIVEVLRARDRQGAHERAQFLRVVLETGLRSSAASGSRPGELSRYAADEVRAGLMVTPNGADWLLGHASEIFVRLPILGEAMFAGELDESRARVFTNWMPGVPDELAHKVCEKLVPKAPEWTTSQLRERIKRMILAQDPEWARRQHEASLEERDVAGFRDPEGTATLTGRHLPVHRAAASSDRIDRLAKSAKTAGDPRRIGHLRAELYLGLLDGTYVRMDDAEILAHLLANRPEDDDDLDDDPGWADDLEPEISGAPEPETGGALEPADGTDLNAPASVRSPERSPARGGVELQVRLSTLLGGDDAPAELAGWGPVHSALARTIAARLGDAEWRWAVTTPEGYLCAGGITTTRPTGTPRAAAPTTSWNSRSRRPCSTNSPN